MADKPLVWKWGVWTLANDKCSVCKGQIKPGVASYIKTEHDNSLELIVTVRCVGCQNRLTRSKPSEQVSEAQTWLDENFPKVVDERPGGKDRRA